MDNSTAMTFVIPAAHLPKFFALSPHLDMVQVTSKEKTKGTVEVSMVCTAQELYELGLAMGRPETSSQYA